MNRSQQLLLSMQEHFVEGIPKLLTGTLIFTCGIGLAFVLRALMNAFAGKLIQKSGPGLARFFHRTQLQKFAKGLGQFIFWLTIVLSITIAAEVLEIGIVSVWFRETSNYLPNLVGALFILVVGTVFGRMGRQLVTKSTRSAGLEQAELLGLLVYGSILTTTILIAVKQIGIEIEFLMYTILAVLVCLLLGGAVSFGVGSAPIVTNILSLFYVRRLLQRGTQIRIDDIEGTIIDLTQVSIVVESAGKNYIIPARRLNDAILEYRPQGS